MLPSFEVQWYASNCNYFVHLLCSRFGIDNFNIFTENQLHLMLKNRGVELIFHNSFEFCFRCSMKAYLRQHEQFSIDFTELAIFQGLQAIIVAIHCGFVI